MANYRKKYTKDSFWKKVKKYAEQAGRKVIGIALILYYCMIDPATPAWAKAAIAAALGYFIFPLDLIPDFTPPPPAGYADDFLVLSNAMVAVGIHIKSKHKKQANEQLDELFG